MPTQTATKVPWKPGSEWTLPDTGADVEEGALRAELAGVVQQALAGISPEHRAVVVLHHVEGMAVDDIARTLGVAVGTVKSRLHRARAELRRRLAHYVEQ